MGPIWWMLAVRPAHATGLEATPFVAAILVNFISFIGAVFLFPPLRRAMVKPVVVALCLGRLAK